jgi:hypothetical protein
LKTVVSSTELALFFVDFSGERGKFSHRQRRAFMKPIAFCVSRLLGRFVGAFRVLDSNGLGTDEVLFSETPVRKTRKEAIADAIQFLSEV